MSRLRTAFTLVELLVVVGIVAVLVGILMPSLARVRASARTTQCASNLHQLSLAFSMYVANSTGHYPPNLSSPSPGLYWCDDDRIGRYLPVTRPPVEIGKAGGGVYLCPEDPPPAYLSYSMNVWASCEIDDSVSALSPAGGIAWNPHTANSADLILLAESYSTSGSQALGWYAPQTIGTAGNNAVQRFGGGGGISPPLSAKRWGYVTSELDFMRHRTPGTVGTYTQPVGRLNVAFSDGHVSTLSNSDLVNGAGALTGLAYWSPEDWGGN